MLPFVLASHWAEREKGHGLRIVRAVPDHADGFPL